MANVTTISAIATVLTKGSLAENFYPMTRWYPAAHVAQIRAKLEMQGNTGDCRIAGAYQITNDPEGSLASAQATGNFQTTDGTLNTNAWDNISSSTTNVQWIRFGVVAKNGTASGVFHACRARLKLDIQSP